MVAKHLVSRLVVDPSRGDTQAWTSLSSRTLSKAVVQRGSP